MTNAEPLSPKTPLLRNGARTLAPEKPSSKNDAIQKKGAPKCQKGLASAGLTFLWALPSFFGAAAGGCPL